MNLLDYQAAIDPFAVYPNTHGRQYARLGLFGEAGEIANQAKKILRDDNGQLTEERRVKLADELGDVLWYATRLAHEHGILLAGITASEAVGEFTFYDSVEELGFTIGVIISMDDDLTDYVFGDLLRDITALAVGLDTTLEEVAAANVAKLQDRVKRGTLQGSGDGR